MTAFPPISHEIVRRAAACDMAYWALRVEALRSLPGNPYGAEAHRFGQLLVLIAARTNNPDFNRVTITSDDDLAHLEELLAWYAAHHTPCRFDLVPPLMPSDAPKRLTALGYYASGFKSVLYGTPQAINFGDGAPRSSALVRLVASEGKDVLTETYLDGFEIPQGIEARIFMGESLRPLVGHPDMHFLFALVNGEIAGMGALYLHERVGYLAGASTLPAYRGLGCQTALLRERMRLAAEAGCDLLIGNAAVGSVSQRNMEKAGLRLAYTRVLWTAL